MPFKSKAQRAYLFIHHPSVAKEFADATPPEADLPEHVKKERAKKGLSELAKRKKPSRD